MPFMCRFLWNSFLLSAKWALGLGGYTQGCSSLPPRPGWVFRMPCTDPSVNTIDHVSCETEASVSCEKWVPWLRVGRCQLGVFALPCTEAAVGTQGCNWTVECSDESLLLFWDSAASLYKSVTSWHWEEEAELWMIICHFSLPPALCCPALLSLWRSCSLQLGQSQASWSWGSSSGAGRTLVIDCCPSYSVQAELKVSWDDGKCSSLVCRLQCLISMFTYRIKMITLK